MWRLPSLGMPVLCVLGLEVETMGWGTRPEDVVPVPPARGRFVPLDGVGPLRPHREARVVADLVMEFLA